MKRMSLVLWKSLFFSLLLVLTNQLAFSQNFFGQPFQHVHDEKCASIHLEKIQEEELGIYGSREYFESWMKGKIQEIQKAPSAQSRSQNVVRTIPVVVHVIHNGTPIGQGANIPKAQIDAQIRILSEDFRRLNQDANQTPSDFLGVAADANIEFVLAKQDPRGLPTDGINRLEGPQTTYSPNDAGLIGQLALWPPEEYMNIWVVPLVSPFIGYASFPISELPGLNFPANSRETDGVTVDYRYFGEGGSAVSGSRGRTLTHEVGHFFGLRHIWGDGDCGVDDFVEDTPLQDSPNNSCRINNARFTCDTRDMAENFMDYTPDACMNLFTEGQVERFDVVLEFSPRRASLVNNRATEEPVLVPNDLGFLRIIDPQDFICSGTINPRIEVLNTGNNRITSARIQIRNNGTVLETKTFSLNLLTGETAVLDFNEINLSTTGTNSFEAEILLVNNTADGNSDNNTVSSAPRLQSNVTLPYTFRFEELNDSWIINNPDNDFTWQQQTISISGTSQNTVFIRHYEYDAQGELDYLISPQIDLSQYPNAQLTFNMAHGPYNASGFGDFLYVAVSTDCGNTFDILEAPYRKDRDFLQTSDPTLDEFIPTSESQFRREIVNLAPYADLGNVRIAFVTRNGFGNNIYLKDIEILTEEKHIYAIKLENLISPSPVTNGDQTQELIEVTNTGNLPISGFLFSRQSNNSPTQTFLARGVALAPGNKTNIALPNSISDGLNTLKYELNYPNFDQNSQHPNTLTRYVNQNSEFIRTPWRQNFNNVVSINPWISINPENNLESWVLAPLQTGPTGSNVANLIAQQGMNSYWLGSPVFDLKGSRQASVFFDRAAGAVSPGTVLKLMVSTDGGVNFEEVYRRTGSEITTVEGGDVNPNNSEDYIRDYVNLTDFTGPGNNKIRLALVLEGGDINNTTIYINNLELFLSANPEPVDPGLGNTIIYPNPATDIFNVVFNFRNFESVNIQIFSPTGALVHDVDYPNTLNQTYSFSSRLFSKGLFIVKITSNSITETRKLYLH